VSLAGALVCASRRVLERAASPGFGFGAPCCRTSALPQPNPLPRMGRLPAVWHSGIYAPSYHFRTSTSGALRRGGILGRALGRSQGCIGGSVLSRRLIHFQPAPGTQSHPCQDRRSRANSLAVVRPSSRFIETAEGVAGNYPFPQSVPPAAPARALEMGGRRGYDASDTRQSSPRWSIGEVSTCGPLSASTSAQASGLARQLAVLKILPTRSGRRFQPPTPLQPRHPPPSANAKSAYTLP
jgi:hypothetical protein